MKKALTSVLLMFLTTTFSPTLKAQNLAPNPSFEVYDTCPNNVTQINRAVGWSGYKGTPDYFNACAPTGIVSVPSNNFGYQYPKTGNGYAGIGIRIGDPNAGESMGVQLSQTLIVGQRYLGSFWVNKTGKPIFSKVACNKIGLRLSTVPYTSTNPVPIDNHAQIYTDSIITDTLNWVQISGSFIADSAYQYLSIGNFFDSVHTSYIWLDSTSLDGYYFIDDVMLSSDTGEDILVIDNNEQIKVFPNPANNWIKVEGKESCQLFIYDILGRVCFTTNVTTSSNKLDISNLNKGIYFVEMKTLKENIVQKLVIE